MLLVAIGAPLGHPARSLGCNRPLRTLRSRRTRPDTHEIPLLCGRRQRQLFCSRGPPAAEGVEARGGCGGGVRHVLHGIGSVASVGPKGRHAGSPRQVAPAGAGAVLSLHRCWLARSRCRLARCRLAPAPALKGPPPPSSSASAPLVARGRSVRQLPFPAPHSLTRGPTRGRPLTRSAPFVHVACCGFSPARGGSAGTRRHTPRGSPSAPPLHDPNPGPPTLDLSLALRLTLRLTLTLTLTLTLGLTLTLILNLTPTRRCPAPASYSPVTAHPALGTCATKKPAHHLVAFAVNIDG